MHDESPDTERPDLPEPCSVRSRYPAGSNRDPRGAPSARGIPGFEVSVQLCLAQGLLLQNPRTTAWRVHSNAAPMRWFGICPDRRSTVVRGASGSSSIR